MGIFVALAAAIALSLAGARVRAAHRPEPPNPAAEEEDWAREPREAREARRARRPRPRAESTAVTEALSDLPDWEGDVPEPPGRVKRADPPGVISEPPTPARERKGDDEEEPPDRLF